MWDVIFLTIRHFTLHGLLKPMACGGVNVLYCTPPCVIHLQALQVCMPAVHKSPHITLHHLSFLPSRKEVEWHHAAHSVSREHAIWSVATQNRSPTGGISFPSGEFLSYAHGSLPRWAISSRPDSVTSWWMAWRFDTARREDGMFPLHTSAVDMAGLPACFAFPEESAGLLQVTWVIKDAAGRPRATGVSWLQAGWWKAEPTGGHQTEQG